MTAKQRSVLLLQTEVDNLIDLQYTISDIEQMNQIIAHRRKLEQAILAILQPS